MNSVQSYPALLADVGGTNARFTLEIAPQKFVATLVLKCANYPTISDAIRAYLMHPLALEAGARSVGKAGIAIANPIGGDIVKMTNHHWSFSIQSVRDEFNFALLLVINDFKALAMALPFLNQAQKYQVGEGRARANAVIGLVGAGTGLGVSALIPTRDGWTALDSEGGHVSFAPQNQLELDILQFALQRYSHVSAERFMSGSGIQLIYEAIAARAQHTGAVPDAPEITRRGLAKECALCVDALNIFCEMLGAMAGNLAVTLGAQGGVYIGGGIVPRLGQFFSESNFRQCFVQKGRFNSYLNQIPTFVITEPYPAFIGISALLSQ